MNTSNGFAMSMTIPSPFIITTFNFGQTLVLKDRKAGKRAPVDYSKKTALRKHFIESLNLFTSNPLSKGNSKLDSSMLVWDILAAETCKNCKTCLSTCYAMKSQQQYPGTYNRRSIHTWMIRNDRSTMERMITDQLTKEKERKIVRIHSAGDFDSQGYLDMWTRIIAKFPHIKFYTYTKVMHLLDFSLIMRLKNFNAVESILPDGSKNYGDVAFLTRQVEAFGGIICPYGMPGKGDESCGVTCKACVTTKRVYFKIH
jgi:hypothetical protein